MKMNYGRKEKNIRERDGSSIYPFMFQQNKIMRNGTTLKERGKRFIVE